MDYSTSQRSRNRNFANSFTISYLGKALMWNTLITQRGEVSGFVRILHQVLGYHMINAPIYILLCVHLTLACLSSSSSIQLIPPLHWFNTTTDCYTSLSLHVLFSSNLDSVDQLFRCIGSAVQQLQLCRNSSFSYSM